MTTITQKERGKGWNLLRLMEIRGYQKKDYLIYKIFYTNLIVTTKQKIRAEPQIINKEKTEKTITENHQTEMAVRYTREKKQWKYRTTRKQKIKWQY